MVPAKRVAFCGDDGPEGGPGSSDDAVVPATVVTEYSPEDLAKLSPEERKQVKAALRREKNRASAKRSQLRKEAYNTKLEEEVRYCQAMQAPISPTQHTRKSKND
jgi:hypothetical protein